MMACFTPFCFDLRIQNKDAPPLRCTISLRLLGVYMQDAETSWHVVCVAYAGLRWGGKGKQGMGLASPCVFLYGCVCVCRLLLQPYSSSQQHASNSGGLIAGDDRGLVLRWRFALPHCFGVSACVMKLRVPQPVVGRSALSGL